MGWFQQFWNTSTFQKQQCCCFCFLNSFSEHFAVHGHHQNQMRATHWHAQQCATVNLEIVMHCFSQQCFCVLTIVIGAPTTMTQKQKPINQKCHITTTKNEQFQSAKTQHHKCNCKVIICVCAKPAMWKQLWPKISTQNKCHFQKKRFWQWLQLETFLTKCTRKRVRMMEGRNKWTTQRRQVPQKMGVHVGDIQSCVDFVSFGCFLPTVKTMTKWTQWILGSGCAPRKMDLLSAWCCCHWKQNISRLLCSISNLQNQIELVDHEGHQKSPHTWFSSPSRRQRIGRVLILSLRHACLERLWNFNVMWKVFGYPHTNT